jgi:hypothetical protein
MVTIGGLFGSRSVSAAAGVRYLYGSGSQTGGREITIRVQITEPAPAEGTAVLLSSSSAAIDPPATITVPAGETELQFKAPTNPVAANQNVTVSASANGVSRSRIVLIKAPVLTSLGLQTVIRHNGVGKVIARISGPAPASGISVDTSTNPAGYLDLGDPITIPAGANKISLAVPASLLTAAEVALPDQPVDVTITYGGASFTKTTIIRDFGDGATVTPMPPTATPAPTDAPTETQTPTEAPTDTPTSTATVTATPVATQTPLATSTPCTDIICDFSTATPGGPIPPSSVIFTYAATSVLSGESFPVQACLDTPALGDAFASFTYSSLDQNQIISSATITPASYTFSAGEQCIELTYLFTAYPDAAIIPAALFGTGFNNYFTGETTVTIVSTVPTPTGSETPLPAPSSITFSVTQTVADSFESIAVEVCLDVPAVLSTSIWLGYIESNLGGQNGEHTVTSIASYTIEGDTTFEPGERCHTATYTFEAFEGEETVIFPVAAFSSANPLNRFVGPGIRILG